MSQKEIVYNAITSLVEIEDHSVELTKEQKTKVMDIVAVELRKQGQISEEADAKYPGEDLRKKYVPGLVNNWMRKDTRINGGSKYVAKNPGSRAGCGDEKLKEMKKLEKQFEATGDETRLDIIRTAIEARKKQLAAEKAKQVAIDLSVLPSDLIEALEMEESEEESA